VTGYTRFVIWCFKAVGIVGGSLAALLVAFSILDLLADVGLGFGWKGIAFFGLLLGLSVGMYRLARFLEKELR